MVVFSTGEGVSCLSLLGGDVWVFVLLLVGFSTLIFLGLGCCRCFLLSFLILLVSGFESLLSTLSLLAGGLRALRFTLTIVVWIAGEIVCNVVSFSS